MPEFIFVAVFVAVSCLVKHQEVRLLITQFKQNYFSGKPARSRNDPYRNNPEVERDIERRRADAFAMCNAKLEDELAVVRQERDLAFQQQSVSALKMRLAIGSAFALGVFTCFTSLHIVPQVSSDALAERAPTARPMRIAHHRLVMNRDRITRIPIQFFWTRMPEINEISATRWEKESQPHQQNPRPTLIFSYGLPVKHEPILLDNSSMEILMTFD